jgi:hypothetical protein
MLSRPAGPDIASAPLQNSMPSRSTGSSSQYLSGLFVMNWAGYVMLPLRSVCRTTDASYMSFACQSCSDGRKPICAWPAPIASTAAW